jgi:glycosyltransferase involved in cell wall biosynthesis
MRIAVYHNLPPGGALRVVRDAVVALSRIPDVTIEVFTVDLGDRAIYGNTVTTSYPGAAAVHVTPVGSSLRRRLGDLDRLLAIAPLRAAERRVATAINVGGFDAVLVHHCQLTHSPALLHSLRIPSVYYVNEARRTTTDFALRPRLTRQHVGGWGLARRLGAMALDVPIRAQDLSAARSASNLVASSHTTADAVLRAYGRRALVAYPGVDLDRFSPACRDRALRILSVGALHPSKGHDLVVRAVARIPLWLRPGIVVVNDRAVSGYAQRLRTLAENTGVVLDIRTNVDDAELVDLYRSSLATVCAADIEPLGLTPLESIACGTPVVAIDEGGYRETVQDGVNGLLTEASEGALAEAISSIATGKTEFHRGNLRSSVDPRWRWDVAAQRLLDLCARTAAACSGDTGTRFGSTLAASSGRSRARHQPG